MTSFLKLNYIAEDKLGFNRNTESADYLLFPSFSAQSCSFKNVNFP